MQTTIVTSDTDPRISVPEEKLIYAELDLDGIDPEGAEIYREGARLSESYIALEPERQVYWNANPCVPKLFTCMDEKEQDTELALGLPNGLANVYQTAGNKLGDTNLVLRREFQSGIDRAFAAGKRVLVLFVTHESKCDPDHDSCAAWSHDGRAADENAIRQVRRFNRDYVDRGAHLEVVQRHVIAVRLKSYTDFETRVWHGETACIDPLEYMPRNGGPIDDKALFPKVLRHFSDVFPQRDPRFSGLHAHEWSAVLGQMSHMFLANIHFAHDVATGKTKSTKAGHRGRCVLVGRGAWGNFIEVNRYFKVSDFTPDMLRECRIAGKYVAKNAILDLMRRDDTRLSVPFHVNVPYDLIRPGDRCNSIAHAVDLARAIKHDWDERLSGREPRLRFLTELVDALKHDDVNPLEIPSLDILSPDSFRYYVSVSPRETRRPELVATGGDL
ncbi:hypothetical protein HZC53_03060 [Candidatus Uhrbacteria bacterium]|nr:hypothetical protein [Candidatus Uhrbacteria bacterium]